MSVDDSDELPPGLADDSDELPPGLADDPDELPPGLSDDSDELPPGLADDPDELPPGLADPKPKPKDPAKVTEAQKKKARELWERLAKSRPGPNNKDLMYLARFVPLLSSAATKTLLGRNLTLAELKELVQHVPKAQDAATKQIIKKYSDDLTEEDLRFLFTQTKSLEVGKYLLKKYPNDANLGLAERTTDELNSVVAKMRKQEPTKAVLREIDRKL